MRVFIAITCIIIWTASIGGTRGANYIAVRPEAEVRNSMVTLGEIASIQGADSKRLMDIQVCAAPLPGRCRQVTKSQIMVSLRKAGLADGTFDILSPESIVIKRAFNTITGQQLFGTAKQYIISSSATDSIISVEPARLPNDEQVPVGKLELRVKENTKCASKGRISVPVEIVVEGKVYRTVNVPVLARVLAPVLVAVQPISSSSILNKQNCALEVRDITFLPDDVVTSEPGTDWTASLTIPQGAVIRKSWLSQPPAVHAGEAVVVVVTNGGVRVSDKGIAAQDGRLGQKIKVRFPGQTREVHATVTGVGTAEIIVGGRT